MKQFFILIIFVLTLQNSFGQLGLQDHIVTNQTITVENSKSICISDIDNDGNLDIVSSINGDRLVWFKNINGDGIFSDQLVIANEIDEGNVIRCVDIDNDGDMDVVSSSNFNNRISWYKNLSGSGTFGNQQIITTEVINVSDFDLADLDDDGDLDLVSSSISDSKLAWYENVNGLGLFGSQQIIKNQLGVKSLALSDVDGDLDIDLVYSTESIQISDKVALLENLDGFGSFGNEIIIQSTCQFCEGYESIISDDFDNDGDNDIAVAGGDTISWYENIDGGGSFSGEQVITTDSGGLSTFLCSSDIDNDGDLDILSGSQGKLAWSQNTDGNGNFNELQTISTNTKSKYFVRAGDINGDNKTDIVSSYFSEIGWQRNVDNSGVFESPNIITIRTSGPTSSKLGDINNDGSLDIITTSISDRKISWFPNNLIAGDFQVQKIVWATDDIPNSATPVDLDGDGDLDILTFFSSGFRRISWFENLDGNGDYGTETIIDQIPGSGPKSIFAADLDGDGFSDVVSSTGTSIFWYKNSNGNGIFESQQLITDNNNFEIYNYQLSDIDSDNDLDIVLASEFGSSSNIVIIKALENLDGLGNFGNSLIVDTFGANSTATNKAILSVNDIDNDNVEDIVLVFGKDIGSNGLQQAELCFLKGQGNFGDFDSKVTIRSNINYVNFLLTLDLDTDSDIDIIYDRNFKLFSYFNINGLGTYSNEQNIKPRVRSIESGDINNDGQVDLLFSELYNRVIWSENLGLNTNKINGNLKNDINSNGCDDFSDLEIANVMVSASNGFNTYSTFTVSNGYYEIYIPEFGSFATSASSDILNYYTSNPISQTSNFVDLGNIEIVDFCMESIINIDDLNISVYPSVNDPRPGFDTTYQIVYKNTGTTQLSGSVSFEFDDFKMQFLNASETVASQTGNTLNFDFTDLNPFETRTIDLEFNVFPPPTTNIDDVLLSTATINPISGDETEGDNVFTLEQTVIGSYDPNDIAVLQGDEILIVDTDKYLNYLIRFQNTGTASAINVRVEHVLDDKLDFTSMQLESLSHSGRVEITNGSEVQFIFDNINLPNSTSDEPNSHGYIAFKIKPKSNVEVGDVISGVADIYFDFNPPIITNTVNTEVVDNLGFTDEGLQSVRLYPNPANNNLEISSNQIMDKVILVDINGRQLNALEILTTNYELDVSSLSKGIYFLEIQSGDSKSTRKFIKN